MAVQGIGREDDVGDHRLRRRHQRRVGRDAVARQRRPAVVERIGPVMRQAALTVLAAQQRHGIAEVGVQRGVMPDHGGDAGIAQQRRTERPEPIARRATALQQLQRASRLAQARHRVGRHRGTRRQRCGVARPGTQGLEQIELHAGRQRLRIDKAGAEIEQLRRPLARNRPRQRKRRRPALERSARQQPIPPAAPAITEARGGGRGWADGRGHGRQRSRAKGPLMTNGELVPAPTRDELTLCLWQLESRSRVASGARPRPACGESVGVRGSHTP